MDAKRNDLKYLNRCLDFGVVVDRDHLDRKPTNLDVSPKGTHNLTNYEKCELKIYLARKKRHEV